MKLGILPALQCNFQFQNQKVLPCNFLLELPMPILKPDKLRKMARLFYQASLKYKQSNRPSFHGNREQRPCSFVVPKNINVKYFLKIGRCKKLLHSRTPVPALFIKTSKPLSSAMAFALHCLHLSSVTSISIILLLLYSVRLQWICFSHWCPA